ncbi:MAG TPA: DUF5050 domain-containing protein [Terriglobia bacterium]|nr:DUF5050 domain-containing protein [Terriglobia bacterium]
MPCNRKPGAGKHGPGTFTNWAETFTVTPRQIFRPTTLDELIAIVKQAEAEELSVHAAGSGWSFEEVMTATGYIVDTSHLNHVPKPKINPPQGLHAPPLAFGSSNRTTPLVQPHPLNTLSETMTGTPYPKDLIFGALTPAALERNLVHVEAGIKIADLYIVLEGIPSGVTTPDGNWHGYGVKTLGGSGGQAIAGVVTTSTHGGDDHDARGPIRPIPDMVQGIRLAGAGGVEYFIQRGGNRAIVDPAVLAQLDPCLAGPGRIITRDDVFNAAVVSMGRMGLIYSLVLEVEPQYFLKEVVTKERWKQVIPKISGLREENRFLEILILPYGDYEQAFIPYITYTNDTTASTPVAVPDPNGGVWIYYQGTDNGLWKVKDDGTGQLQINDNSTASTPFVVPDPQGAWVYFKGTDSTLWKVRDNGTLQAQIGNNTTASTPFVVPDPNGGPAWVYFQGTDNTLWKVQDDGNNQSQVGNNTTASTPFVIPDPNGGPNWVYFQGTDNTLWKVQDDGSNQSQIGNNTTSSTPFVVPDPNGGPNWVYFQGTDNALWKVRDDGSQQYHIGENMPAGKQYTASTPFVIPDVNGAWVYYQGTDNTLWKIRDDGSQQSQINNNTTASTPFVLPDPNGGAWVYFEGTDNTLWKVRDDGSRQSPVQSATSTNNTTASVPFVVPDAAGEGAWVYFQGTDTTAFRGPGTLWKVRDDGTQQSQIGNNTTASTPFVVPDPNGGPAWVYFQGTDTDVTRGPGTLWKIRDDGTQQSQIGNNTTASMPFVVPDPAGGPNWVYFQGTDTAIGRGPGTLWKVRDDGTQQSQIGNNTTASTPFVVPDPGGGPTWVYFQGTDDALWKVRDDGTQQYHIGENQPAGKQYTASTPFVVPDPNGGAWVYYQGTDDTLWKIRDDGTQQSQIGNNTTASTPFVAPDPSGGPAWVYFQGTDIDVTRGPGTLWRVREDGTDQSKIGNNTTASTPFVTAAGWVYFQGTDTDVTRGEGTLWKTRTEPDHTCILTTRNEVPASQFSASEPYAGFGSKIFTYACEERPEALARQIQLIIAGLAAFAAGTIPLLLLIPLAGPLLAGLDAAAVLLLIEALTPLLDPSVTIGDYLAAVVNILDQFGQIGFTEGLVNTILGSLGPQAGSTREDVSFKIMDTYDYKGSCNKALSIEVGFNADDTAYIDYLTAVFNRIDGFASQNILTGAYISLRYCAGSEALLAIEQWPHTVTIEVSALAHLTGEEQVLRAFEDETANHVGLDGRLPTVHWGQLNSRSAAQVEATFPKINVWRSALARLSRKGKLTTFDNDFCQSHGLEVLGGRNGAPDLSYLVPLLLS